MERLGAWLVVLLVGCGSAAAQSPDAGRICAAVLQGAGVSVEAVIEACTVVIESPADAGSEARALRYRGLAHERQGDLRRALADLDAALALSPDDDWALQGRARVHLALGDREGARGDYRRLAELRPNETRWRIALGELGAAPPAPPPQPVQEARRLEAQEPPPSGAEPAIRQTELPPDKAMLERREQAAARQRELNRRAQMALAEFGYDLGLIDGVFGPRSRQALGDWLRRQGRAPRGEIDEALVESLESAVATAPLSPPAPVAMASDGEARATASEATPPPAPREEPMVAAVEPAATAVPPPAPKRQAMAVPAAPVDRRVALVIGNSSYRDLEPLRNPRRDADDMAAALGEIGFEVLKGFDLDRNAMDELTSEFARKAATADLALAYYSGHGLQFEGENFLVPVDGRLEDRRDLRRLVKLDQLIEDTSEARKLAVVVVDACRNDPVSSSLTRGLRQQLGGARSTSLGKGLARPGFVPPQTLVAYATATGEVAYDGNGRNSPYVEALLRHLKTPDLEVRLLFGKVRDDVARATGDAQLPDIYSSLGGEESFLVPGLPEPTGLDLVDLTLAEREAIQRSLQWLGVWDGAVDGELSGALVASVRQFQRSRGEEDTGRLSPGEMLALHRQAALQRPPEPLPPVDLTDAVSRSAIGDPEGQRLMAMILDPAFTWQGLPKDRARAIQFYELAARQGDALATARLGMILSAPGRPAQDQAAARPWLEQAARAGEPLAALRLAELLLDGPEAEVERERAVELLAVAAASRETDGIAAARLRELGQPVAR